MSSNPLLPTDPVPTPQDTQTVVDNLGSFAPIAAAFATAANASQVPLPESDPPRGEMSYSEQFVRETYYKVWWSLVDSGCPRWIATWIAFVAAGAAGFVQMAVQLVIWGVKTFGVVLLKDGLALIDQFRKELDPQVAGVSISVLNELFGTDFADFGVTTGTGLAGHLTRASEVGALVHQQLISQFEAAGGDDAIAGARGAESFTGMIVNFGTATALLGLTGEMAHSGILKDFRLIGEQVSSGLGFSRLHRRVFGPLLKVAIIDPYQRYLNARYHPTHLKVAELINPYAQTHVDHELLTKELVLEGYDGTRIQALLDLHAKRLTVDEVEILHRWGYWDDTSTHKYIVGLGWPEELADTVGRIPELKRIDGRITKLIDTLESNVDQGHMTVDDALAIIKTLAVTADELAIIQATMITKTKVPHKSLTLTEIENAFSAGIFTADDVITRLQQAGFQGDDLQTLTTLVLLKFAKTEEAKAVAQYVWDTKVAKAKAKGLPLPPKPAILE